MSEQGTDEYLPVTHAPPRSEHRSVRLFNAAVASGIGGTIGFLLGSLGDSKERRLAQRVMMVIGVVFGFATSMFASKGKDIRPYDMSNAPDILRHHVTHETPVQKTVEAPQLEIAGSTAIREGQLQEVSAQEVAR
jgi:hypothetical protein